MKKLLTVLAVAVAMTACNNSGESADAAKAPADTIKAATDSGAAKSDTSKMADTSMKMSADTSKKAK